MNVEFISHLSSPPTLSMPYVQEFILWLVKNPVNSGQPNVCMFCLKYILDSAQIEANHLRNICHIKSCTSLVMVDIDLIQEKPPVVHGSPLHIELGILEVIYNVPSLLMDVPGSHGLIVDHSFYVGGSMMLPWPQPIPHHW